MLYNDFDPNFFNQSKTKIPNATDNEMRLMAYINLDISTDQIAQNLGITKEGVRKEKYRLKKKLSLESDIALMEFLKNNSPQQSFVFKEILPILTYRYYILQ